MSIKGQGNFLTLGKVVYIQKFKPNFLRNYFADLNQIVYESFPGFVCLGFTRPRYQVSVYRTTGPLVVYSDTSLAISDFDSEGMILILIATLLADWLEGGGGLYK